MAKRDDSLIRRRRNRDYVAECRACLAAMSAKGIEPSGYLISKAIRADTGQTCKALRYLRSIGELAGERFARKRRRYGPAPQDPLTVEARVVRAVREVQESGESVSVLRVASAARMETNRAARALKKLRLEGLVPMPTRGRYVS